ncbi:hypothetical protein BDV93DRAFT_528176 [Ceratobasidium sp. AG-I]|nr:hypothetical protein BDV93DRAFT_528176 [Ceratobasidium sp. AG-I]
MVFGDDRGWVEETIPGFFRLLVEKTPGLKELSLEYNEKHRLSTQSLQILQPLPLRKLSIPGGTRKRIGGPQAVRNLIQIWPLLEKLDLCSYEADFEDLRHIIPFCPQLSVLRLDMDTVISDSGLSWYQLHRTISRPMGALVPFKLVSSHSQFSSWNGMRDMYVPEELDALSRYFANVRPFMNYQVCKDREDPWYPEEHKFLKDINSKIHQYSQLDQS